MRSVGKAGRSVKKDQGCRDGRGGLGCRSGGFGTQEHMWHRNDRVYEAASVGVRGDES